MTSILWRSDRTVALIGAGPVPSHCLDLALERVSAIIAADGGANVSLPAPHRLDAMIGDCDSVDDIAALRNTGVAVHEIAEQDSTDLEKCLYSISAPLILGVGFLGGRVDHQLAAMTALARYPDQRVILLGREDLVFLAPASLSLSLAAGTRFSIYPLTEIRGVKSQGLKWPIDGLVMRPNGQIGTSNMAIGGTVEATFDRIGALVILPLDQLDTAIDAISA